LIKHEIHCISGHFQNFGATSTYRECMRTDGEDRAPICPFCGVTALPADAGLVLDPRFICENPDCEAFGEAIEAG
jgi:hypothetical protein